MYKGIRPGREPMTDTSDKTLRADRKPSPEPGEDIHLLVAIDGAMEGERIEVGGDKLVLGRSSKADVRISDAQVSSTHCVVRVRDGEIRVTDVGSTNGTFVDGERVAPTGSVALGSVLEIGEHVFRHERRTRREFEREERFQEDLRRAREYVLGLIPEPLLTDAFELDWVFLPSAVLGGDLLGYHVLEDGRCALYVLDVCDHGPQSALHSAAALHAVRNPTESRLADPSLLFERLNETFAMETHGGLYFTAWYGVYDPRTRRLEYASAGHPPALLQAPEGGALTSLATKNPPIGALGRRSFAKAVIDVPAGAKLYVFSDGVYEITDDLGKDGSYADFETLVAEPSVDGQGEPERLLQAVRNARGKQRFEDDFSLLVATLL